MAWIESHTTLGRHPKTRRLCRLLGTSLPQTIGHLHLLWHWVIEFAEDGVLTGYTPDDLAEAAYWEGDPQLFVDALISAGFIDDCDGSLVIHDWRDYAGRLLSDRERKRAARRGADNPVPGSSTSMDSLRTVRGTSADSLRTVRANQPTNRNQPTVTNQPTTDKPGTVPAQQRERRLPSSPPSPDFEAVVDAWNRICAGEGPGPPLPEVLGVTKQRRQRFVLRCRELARTLRDGEAVCELSWWERLFERIRASPFLRGEGESGWQATLDWLLESSEHLVRVLEGAYDARASPVGVRARASPNGTVTPERLSELERLYGSASDLPPSELMRREREAIQERKRREEAS